MNFTAFERSLHGTGASRRLRNSGKTPGIVYGGEGAEPQMVELDHNALFHALKKEAFHSSVLDMELGGTTSKVLLRDVQYHPYKQLVLHVDFQRVDAKTRLHMKVPMHYVNEENSPAVKLDQCLVNHVVNELDVSCLPSDLPEFIEVDLGNLTKGASVHLKDIKLPRRVSPIIKGGRDNPLLVSVTAPEPEEEEVTPEAAAAAAAAAATPAKPAGKGKK